MNDINKEELAKLAQTIAKENEKIGIDNYLDKLKELALQGYGGLRDRIQPKNLINALYDKDFNVIIHRPTHATHYMMVSWDTNLPYKYIV